MAKKQDQIVKRMRADPAYAAKVESKVREIVTRRFLSGLIMHGDLSIEGKTPKEIYSEVVKLITPNTPISIAKDHTDSIRLFGKEFEQRDEPWIACMFYALWAEHVLNSLVSIGGVRRGLDDATVRQIIRDTNLVSKLGWLFQLLELRPVKRNHVDRLKRLFDFRNQFVHYKWTYIDADGTDNSEETLKKFLVEIRPTFKYLAQYRSRESLNRGKGKIESLAKKAR